MLAQVTPFPRPPTALAAVRAENLQLVDVPLDGFVRHVGESARPAVRAGLLLVPLEPGVEAFEAVVLAAAPGQLRLAEDACADVADQLLGQRVDEFTVGVLHASC